MESAKKHPPTLFIGLGGAGGKIVNRIANILQKRPDKDELKHTMQFFVLDTDKADLDSCTNIKLGHRFVISGFDKSSWAAEKLGRSGVSKPDPDPRVAQWVHDWYNFRSSQGVGAGQIRIESRISLYNCLETTDLITRLEQAILETIDMKNANLAHEVKRFNVFIYYTVAGGTGSGSHLMFAAFLRHLIGSFGWSANIIGVSMLSTFLLPVMPNMRQRADIMANGYAAMKEDEHLLRLKVYADKRDPANKREFIYHPFVSTMEVNESPFDFIYIMDTNPEVYIDQWKDSVADGIYLQLFSPIFGQRNSDYDNFEKNQKRLSRGLYSTFYGSYGCSVMLLPDHSLLKYCTQRKTADLIGEQLLAHLNLALPTGEESYEPTSAQLSRLDTTGRDHLRDVRFFDYMRDRVQKLEKAPAGQDPAPETLKRHGLALYEAGFGINPNLAPLDEAIKVIGGEKIKQDEKIAIQKRILPGSEFDSTAPDKGDGTAKVPGADYRGNLLSHLLSFRDLAAGIGGTIRIGETDGVQFFQKGLFRNFWNHVDVSYLASVGDDLAGWRHMSVSISKSAKDNPQYSEVRDDLALRIVNNRKAIKKLRDVVKRQANEARSSIGRSFVLDFLAHEKESFEIQRLFVIAQLRLSQSYRAAIDKILEEDEWKIESAERLLSEAENALRNDGDLEKAARTDWKERVAELRGGFGAVDYDTRVRLWDDYIRRLSERYAALVYLKFVRDTYDRLAEVLEELSSTFRLFSQQAVSAITKIENEADETRKNPGNQSDTEITDATAYHNDIEALQDFTGERMWCEYYMYFVRNYVELREDEVRGIIASAFSDSRLTTAQDQLDAIAKQMQEIIQRALEPMILGKYTDGNDNRGLTLQQALECEARLKYLDRLQKTGRLDDDSQKLWEKVAKSTETTSHIRSEREMHKSMTEFCRNYLESKIAVAIRRSAVMANIAVQDSEVSEYACRQHIVCYDTDLYGQDNADSGTRVLAFPAIVNSIEPKFKPQRFTEYGKMVIFYQAILGVPPFVFRNLVTGMKEAYNKRVSDRDWANPLNGRQYPLHVDQNWEPGDPGVDETRLPMSLDPEEAVLAGRNVNEARSRFFSFWYALFRVGHIVRVEGRGFFVPAGKLGNSSSEDIFLGETAREAILAMMKSQTAHKTLQEAFEQADPIERARLEAQRDRCRELMGGDAWGRESPDPEIRELAELLSEHLTFMDMKEEAEARARLTTAGYNKCLDKVN